MIDVARKGARASARCQLDDCDIGIKVGGSLGSAQRSSGCCGSSLVLGTSNSAASAAPGLGGVCCEQCGVSRGAEIGTSLGGLLGLITSGGVRGVYGLMRRKVNVCGDLSRVMPRLKICRSK